MLSIAEKTKTCKACGKQFFPAMYKQSSRYCQDPACQKAKLQRSRNCRKNNLCRNGSGMPKVPKKLTRGKACSGRVCRKCGKDAYPNYFYCPICHKSINQDDEYGSMGLDY